MSNFKRITNQGILTMMIALLILLVGIVVLSERGYAADEIASGNCGAGDDEITWTLDAEGTLEISGEGQMDNFSNGQAPWNENSDSIKKIVVNDGVTSLGAFAFQYCTNLVDITIPDTVITINK